MKVSIFLFRYYLIFYKYINLISLILTLYFKIMAAWCLHGPPLYPTSQAQIPIFISICYILSLVVELTENFLFDIYNELLMYMTGYFSVTLIIYLENIFQFLIFRINHKSFICIGGLSQNIVY